MAWKLVLFGKPSPFAGAEEERFLKRIRVWRPVEVVELKTAQQGSVEACLKAECAEFERRVGWDGALVVLDERGERLTSVDFSRELERREQLWGGKMVFVVGSAYGLDPEFRKKAKWLLSLSPMTLSHDHARVLLIEQLYRALCIQKGHGYHHA